MKDVNFYMDGEIIREFGRQLWQIRQQKRLYLKKVAADINVPVRLIEGMELGKFVKYSVMRRLLEYYDTNIKLTLESNN